MINFDKILKRSKLSLIAPVLLLMLGSCTYSVTMLITEGTASDVVDETQSVKADVQAAIPQMVSK